MATSPIRILHLSDFHIGKDDWAQQRLFGHILRHVEEKKASGFIPDFVFLTGDIANRGAKAEYTTFRTEFYLPLTQALGGVNWKGRILGVPGNHDVARPTHDVLNQSAALSPGSKFFDPTREGKSAREQIFPRFKQYKQLMPGDVSSDWVASAAGTYVENHDIRGTSVAVVGMNTAWLSVGEKDRGRLTPGLPMVEGALNAASGASIRIVLGHHPLNWLSEGEAARLRAHFGRSGVVYLHGHMHRADARVEDGSGSDFLVFQAGAAFQARDDEIWRNGLTWLEIDVGTSEVRASPHTWNPDNLDWPIDSGRFPESRRRQGSDWWHWPLPRTTAPEVAKASAWKPPTGWTILDATAIGALRRNVTSEEASRFFDGAEPDWPIAICEEIPRRAATFSLVDSISSHRGTERPKVTLLIGPGGEGKSMILRQVIVDLLNKSPSSRVLWRQDDSALLSSAQALSLPQRKDSIWLIAADSADTCAGAIHSCVKALQATARGDIHFLICARDSDWRASGASRLDWWSHSHFDEFSASGLTPEDSSLIAGAWAAFGDEGLGASAGMPLTDVAKLLHSAATAEASIGEGALLGGMLEVRVGRGLRGHVKSLLDRLASRPLTSGGTLYTAFSYIAAMHAEGFDFLSRPVLAEALGCDRAALQKQVLFPLGRETGSGGGTLLLTRHRRIARAALEVMQDDYGESIEALYPHLARAAMVARRTTWLPEIRPWEFDLPHHFLRSNPGLAIEIGQALYDAHPDSHLAVNLARLYRESGQASGGVAVLSQFSDLKEADRAFWFEWATCAGINGNAAKNVVLAGWSLADQCTGKLPTNDGAKKSLAGLGVAFAQLAVDNAQLHIAQARHAAASLALALTLDSSTRRFCEVHLRESAMAGAVSTDLNVALTDLQRGISTAWAVMVEGHDSEVPSVVSRDMRFQGLGNLVESRGRAV